MSEAEYKFHIESSEAVTSSSPMKTPTKAKIIKPLTLVDWTQSDDEEVEQYLENMLDEANTQYMLDFSGPSPVKTPIKRKLLVRKSVFIKIYSSFYKPQAKPPTISGLVS